MAQGTLYFFDSRDPSLAARIGAVAALAGGASLLIGLYTPLGGVLLALATMGVTFSWFPAPATNLFDARLAAALVVIMAVAIVLTGPGALSVDARLYGRREIIISPRARPPQF